MAAPPAAYPAGKNFPPIGSVPLDSLKSDSVDLAETYRGVQADVAGTITLTFQDGTKDTWTLLAGVRYWGHFYRLWSTGTTATGIHGLR